MEQKNPKLTIPHIVNPYVEESKSKAGRFITLSVFVHAAMVATVALMSFPSPEITKPQLIEIEMMGDGDLLSMPEGAEASGTAGLLDTSNGTVPEAEVAKVAEAVPVAVQALPAQAEPAPLPVKAAAPVVSTPKPAPKAAPVAAAKPAMQKAVTADLETSETGEVPVSQMDDADMQNEFEKIDQTHLDSLAASKKAQEEEAQALALAIAQEEAVQAREARAQERAQAEERARERAAVEMQAAREAKAVADAQAAKEAEASRAAQAAVAAQAAAQASAGKAAAANRGEGSGSDDGAPEGSGNSTSPQPTKNVAGIPGGVRTLGQLRQRPGNRSPQYDQRERLARQEGSVVFYAYVNQDGTLSQFKKAESTGYANLDEKTLAALQRWKFYPGQEGWVEMPFQWSLRGEAQEAGGLLR